MVEQHGKTLVPQIRFAGFTDPWEQRKLGEVAYGFEYGLNAAASDFDGEKKYLRITDIDDQTREFRTDDLSSPDINNPIDDKYLLKEGDILFARTGASVGKTYLYKASDGKTYYAGFLIRAHVSDEADAGFIFQSALTERYKQFVLITSQRSGQPGINAQEYADLLLLLPSLPEQRRIGAFFDRLDSLITLHQRKYDKLCVLKKSMLDKMFPKGGSLYPEIRFAGFTDPWEQRKLGELFEEHSEKDRDDLPALTIIQGGGTVHRDESNRNLQFDRSSLSNYKVVDTGDFIVHLRSFEGGLEKATCYGLVSPAYHIFRGKNVDSDFYYLYFRSKRFIDVDLKPHVYGIRDGRSIDIEGMKTIFIPWTNLAEQRRIGAFFDRLDSLITLHQRKLELLRNIKKSMLDKMFV